MFKKPSDVIKSEPLDLHIYVCVGLAIQTLMQKKKIIILHLLGFAPRKYIFLIFNSHLFRSQSLTASSPSEDHLFTEVDALDAIGAR